MTGTKLDTFSIIFEGLNDLYNEILTQAKGETSEISLQIGDINLTLLDIFGNQKEIKGENGILSLELTGSPQYLLSESESLSSLHSYTTAK